VTDDQTTNILTFTNIIILEALFCLVIYPPSGRASPKPDQIHPQILPTSLLIRLKLYYGVPKSIVSIRFLCEDPSVAKKELSFIDPSPIATSSSESDLQRAEARTSENPRKPAEQKS
jgi:hypothetical protein